jgi:hypothetical protein
MRPATGAIDAIELLPLSEAPAGSDPRVGDVLVVRGWAHQPGADAAFALSIDGGPERSLERSVPRPDVAAALDDPSAADAGFSVTIPTLQLQDGEHALALVLANGSREEIARARFRLTPPVPLANVAPGSGAIDAWTDENGRRTPVAGGSAHVPREQVIRIDGWAADTVSQTPAAAAFALVGEHVVEAAYGFERADVAREVGEQHAYCGFSVSFPGSYVRADGTPLRIVLLASDGITLRPVEPALTLLGGR